MTTFAGQIDDVTAIYTFMQNAVPKTTEASTVRNQFLDWYKNASWWDKNMSSDWYDEIRTRRNQFNKANAVTDAQKALFERVMSTGMTSEEMQGKPRPQIDIKTGAVGSQIKNPTTPQAAGGLNRFLKSGVSGNDVKTWQSFLGLTPPTGYFDKATDSKTRAYQAANGLTVDGIVGPKTWSKAFAGAPATIQPLSANISTAFKSAFSPPAAVVSEVNTPIPKPTSSRKVSKPSAAPELPMVMKASMLPDFSKIPTWAKVAGAAITSVAAGAAILAIKHAH